MKWIGALLGITAATSFSQEASDARDELSIGIPQIPKSTNRIDIYQKGGYMNYDASKGQLGYHGNFQLLTDTGIELKSQNALMDLTKNQIRLDGDISIYQSGLFQRGNSAVFNMSDHSLSTTGLKVSLDPILLEAGQFYTKKDKQGNTYFVGENAGITTHDVSKPNFWMRADRIRVFPEDKITFKNLKIYAGSTPVFWLPYLSQPLDAELGYHFIPGAKSSWGAYLLNRYGFMLGEGNKDSILNENGNPWLQAQAIIDFRTRRGVGTGFELKDTRLNNNPNLTGFKLYYTNDLSPQITRSGLTRNFVNEDRYRLELKHRHTFADNSRGHTFLDADLTWLSDIHYREDFEPKLYKVNPEPINNLSLLHRKDGLLAGLTTHLRFNSFYQTDTRLPEVFIDRVKAPIFGSPVLYEGHASIGSYREWLGDSHKNSLTSELATLLPGDPRIVEINNLLDDRGFNRFHTYHDFSLPLHLKRGVGLAPHFNFGHTKYWAIDNGLAGFDRNHIELGVDFSMKFAKRYSSVKNQQWGLDGLMHVIQPYANYSYLKTNALDPSFRPIDRLTPTTNLRPIRVGRFSAIDELNDWSVLRLGLRNSLITRRDEGSHTWLSMNSYIDVFLNDPELDRDFSNLYNEILWHPLPWVKLDLAAQFPLAGNGSGFSEYSSSATFMTSRNTELTVGYRYLNSHPTLEDSSRVHLRAYTRFNEKWGASFYQQWELDDGTLESQQYSIHRDLGSWSSSLGIIQRNNRIRSELGVMLSFTLKAFPSLSVPLSLDTE